MATYSLGKFTKEDEKKITGLPAAEQLATEIHNHLATELHRCLSPKDPSYAVVLSNLRTHLKPGELASCENIMDVWGKLTEQAKVDHGDYGIIKEVFKRSGKKDLAKIVTQAEDKIRAIMDYGKDVEARKSDHATGGRRKSNIPDGEAPERKKPRTRVPPISTSREVRVNLRTKGMSKRIKQQTERGEAYPFTAQSRSRVVLINICKFDSANVEDIPESQVDMAGLKSVFLQLGFTETDIREEQNLNAQEIKDCLKDEADNRCTDDINCFICVLLSHGKADHIYGCDGATVNIKEMMEMFDGRMVGYPKLFFVEACQGDKKDIGGFARARGNPSAAVLLPTKADLLLALSTFPDHVAWTEEEYGSYFTQSLVSVLKESAHKLDLLDMLTKVNARISEKPIQYVDEQNVTQTVKQVPWISHSLRKYFYFNPEVEGEEED